MSLFIAKKRPLRLNTWITLLVCAVLLVALSVTSLLIAYNTAENTRESLREKTMDIASTVSHSPVVIEGLLAEEEAQVQEYTVEVQNETDVEYIVVMDMNHVRLSHPHEARIGELFVGDDEALAFRGNRYTSVAEGTLGESMRAFVPVWNDEEQIGVVSVGILTERINESMLDSQQMILVGSSLGLFVGFLGAVLLARKVKRTMHGLEPNEISQLLQEREAMLSSVREGILAIDEQGKIVVANEAARTLFAKAGLFSSVIGEDVEDILPEFRLQQVLYSRKVEHDQFQAVNGLEMVVNRVPVYVDNRVVGAIATFREKTELTSVAEQLTGAKTYAETLRAQTHEFMNKLHVMTAMVHTNAYEELDDYIKQISYNYQTEVGWVSQHINDPVLAGFLMNKLSYLEEKHIEVVLASGKPWPTINHTETLDAVITILGNLLDNAAEAVNDETQPLIHVMVDDEVDELYVSIHDNGAGMDEETRQLLFKKGQSTKDWDRGYGLYLTKQALEQIGGALNLTTEKGGGTTFHVRFPNERRQS
ncbi:DcuS/MalK family sensor histidine kinase [Salsuginibacillus kocurii]|uniref:DcuS/MalK family sensor histidine kinase n=1 Tax=Salsuginibacillus kocurii TaxID=427078 RepID=UPI00036D0D73|nr:DcuS/MalK family sensor histidine kinase [Salsuginibacillus kocurii]